MFRQSLSTAVLLASVVALVTPAGAQSSTIRIEPRPYYGAVVTLEQGVRVWRPLPPTSHMIINPTGSPVNLSVADVRETITHNGPVFVPTPVPVSPSGDQAVRGLYGYPGYIAGHRPAHRQHRPLHPRR